MTVLEGATPSEPGPSAEPPCEPTAPDVATGPQDGDDIGTPWLWVALAIIGFLAVIAFITMRVPSTPAGTAAPTPPSATGERPAATDADNEATPSAGSTRGVVGGELRPGRGSRPAPGGGSAGTHTGLGPDRASPGSAGRDKTERRKTGN